MAPSSNVKKISRITIACNACRARKQKCSGGKPVCTQCLEHYRPCDWPEQLKRGPAKGYIEVLENRLHETETVLLKVLSQISDAQLASALGDQSNNGNGSANYAPFSRLGKRGAEYWKKFPLDTARSVREWQNDCSRERSGSTDKQAVQSEPTPITTQHAPRQEANTNDVDTRNRYDDFLEFEARTTPSEASHTEMHTARAEASPPLRLQQNSSTSQLRKRQRSEETPVNQTHLLNSPSQLPPTEARHTSQEPSLWTGAPPIKFQKQFLW